MNKFGLTEEELEIINGEVEDIEEEEAPLVEALPKRARRFLDRERKIEEARVVLNRMFPFGWGERTAGHWACLLYTSPSPRDLYRSRMPSSA